jgi:transglutaminase-like putative cysteine protease
MRFLPIWRSTDRAAKRPGRIAARLQSWSASRELFLLDLAYLAVITPLLLLVKAPMLLFLLLVLILLLAGKKGGTATLLLVALTGLLAVFFSIYGAFNFAGLSRLKLFVELILYLLLLAVSLQRLTRTVNFYLLISPVLLLALSLFFFDSIAMLGYVVFEVFVLLWLILAYRTRADALSSLRITGMLFALSLPWVVLLFFFFPRISFEHASYGFRGDDITRTGHDGKMRLDSDALLVPSERIVMEVGFQNAIPADGQLYFRGSVLYRDKKDHWEPLPAYVRRAFAPQQNAQREMYASAQRVTAYKVSLYPTRKKWLYLLDLPLEAPEGASINADFETILEKPVDEPQHYDAGSALVYRYGSRTEPAVLAYALDVNRSANPRSTEVADKIAAAYPAPKERLDALFGFFRGRNLTYSFRPEPLDLNHIVDSFLYDKRKGYCVHFASTFVTLSRLAGLPARIVTGFKADRVNSVNNYLAVKERDAHAWAEVYVSDHWQRVETTAAAAYVDAETAELLRQTGILEDNSDRLTRLNLYLLYVKYQVETWVLQYSHFRQMRLLEKVKTNPLFAAKLAGSFALLVLASAALFLWLRRPRCGNRLLCLLRPLLTRLQRNGFVREEGETLHTFFARYLAAHPDSALAEVDRLYHRQQYGRGEEDTVQFKKAIRAFLREKHSQGAPDARKL